MLIYPQNAAEKLEFTKIITLLENECLSPLGFKHVYDLAPDSDFSKIQKALLQTKEMKELLDRGDNFPSENYHDLAELLQYFEVPNSVLLEPQFLQVLQFLRTIRDIYALLEKRKELAPNLYKTLEGQPFAMQLVRVIQLILTDEGYVRSGISDTLDKIRKDLKVRERELDRKFDQLLGWGNSNGYLSAEGETVRNGRRVLSVLAENKRQIKGIIHDESATGKTVFIEPEATVELSNALFELQQAEKRELYRILKDLTAKLRPDVSTIAFYQEVAGKFDFIHAKAVLAMRMGANYIGIEPKSVINLKNAKHPILYLHNQKLQRKTIPLDLDLNDEERILVISGPNAGGKSVSLKTTGLLQMMVQSGLLIPADPDSNIGIFSKLFVEVGDEQSIENDLSTFSSKLKHMKFFMENADDATLFLIDEMGTGTDPKPGGALAETFLEDLNSKKARGVVTTHYSNLKFLATHTPGMINGSMAFDMHNLQPLYKLNVGKPGSSHAYEIAYKTGLSESIIEKARSKSGKELYDVDALLATLETDKFYIDQQKSRITKREKELESLIESYAKLKEELEKNKNQVVKDAKTKALQQTDQWNKQFQELLKEYQENQQKAKMQARVQQELSKRKLTLQEEIRVKPKKQNVQPVQIEVGSKVRIINGEANGEVEAIRKDRALVSFGNIKSLLPIADLEIITEKTAKKPELKASRTNTSEITKNFSPNIDVRGKRVEEALSEIEKIVDKAILSGFPSLRILHGTGTGALRNAIRDYLRKFHQIKDIRSEMPELGGDGITLVELK